MPVPLDQLLDGLNFAMKYRFNPAAQQQMLDAIMSQGGSYLLSKDNYKRYIFWREKIGRPDGQFILSKSDMDRILSQSSNPRVWEKELGLPEGSLTDEVMRVDVKHPGDYHVRPSDWDMSGSNEYHLDHDMVPGGSSEAVIDQFTNPEMDPEIGEITQLEVELEETIDDALEREALGATKVAEEEEEEEERVTEVNVTTKVEEEVEEEHHVSVGPGGEVTEEVTVSTSTTTTTTAEIKTSGPEEDNGMEQ